MRYQGETGKNMEALGSLTFSRTISPSPAITAQNLSARMSVLQQPSPNACATVTANGALICYFRMFV